MSRIQQATRVLCLLLMLSTIVIIPIGKAFTASNIFKKISQNNAPCGLNFPIEDNSCTLANHFLININNVQGGQLGQDVILEEVRIIAAHSWVADLDIELISPAGISISLSADNGGGGDNYGDPTDVNCLQYTAFSMDACQSILGAEAPFIGLYLPEGNFNDFNDNSNPNGNWILEICDDAQNDDGVLQFVELVFSNAICPAPKQVIADTVASNSVELSWIPNGNCLSTIIEYGPTGFVPGSAMNAGGGTALNFLCPASLPFNLSNLEELTSYDLYIREQCDANVFSKNACVLSFTTSCQTPSPTIEDHFDDQMVCGTSCGTACPITGTWRNVSTDDQDWLIDTDGTTSTATGPADDITGGGNYLYLESSGGGCQNDKKSILISQCIEINASGGSCHLSFNYHMYGVHSNQIALDISLDGGTTWAALWSIIGEQGNQWNQQFIDLNNYDGQTALFRFVGTTGAGFRGDMALDHIEFFGSINLGAGNNTFFADLDQDGYGDSNNTLTICANLAPANYVSNAVDCDDGNPSINPASSEIPCNFIDENCNGNNDDIIVNNLIVNTATICSGDQASLSINSTPIGDFYWFDAMEGGNLIHIGNTFITPILNGATDFFVQDSVINSCASNPQLVTISVFAKPDIFSPQQPMICEGSTYDLFDLNIVESNQIAGALTFHTSQPTNAINEITNGLVNPLTNQSYFARYETTDGCIDEEEVFININPKPTITILPAGPIEVCPNEEIQVAVQAPANTNYTYVWDNGSPTPTRMINGTNPGTLNIYALTITDDQACTHLELVEVNTVSGINSVSIIAVDEVTFCGGNDGDIILNPFNGTAPYFYNWSGPVSGNSLGIVDTFQLSNLPQGNYRVTITDSSPLGCQIALPAFIINGPSAMIDTIINIDQVQCPGGTDGGIDITVDGSVPTYNWSNGSTTQDLNNVPAGNYSVTITDGICSNILNDLIVSEPSPILFFPSLIEAVTCVNGNDGQIELSLDGGTPPYQFNWSHGSTGKIINGLAAGSYQVTVTDASNCTEVQTNIEITEPTSITADLAFKEDPICHGGANGTIGLDINGGTPPYFYQWNNGAQTKDIQNLIAGNYTLTVMDVNGCLLTTSGYLIQEPTELILSQNNTIDASCDGVDNGSISIELAGGTPPYSYVWSTGETNSNTINGLGIGAYSVTVTDENDCQIIASDMDIRAPGVLDISAASKTVQSCVGVADGRIEVTVTGGTLPYSYEWSNGDQTQNLNNAIAGDYQMTITDAGACVAMTPVYNLEVIAALATEIEFTNDVSCNGQANGNIFIDPPGTGPFDYQWNNGSVTEDLQNLPAGAYTLTMTDLAGCLFFLDTILIQEPELLAIQLAAAENVSCHSMNDGSIDVAITGGTPPFIFSWSNGMQTEDLTNIPAGDYRLTILDANSCIMLSPIISIIDPQPVVVMADAVINVGCAANSSGSIDITVTGGLEPYEYIWSHGSNNSNASGLSPGKYDVTVMDANGCLDILMAVEVKQLIEELTITPTIESNLMCHDDQSGWINIEVENGTGPFQYNWSNGVIDSLNNNLPKGLYNVTVTDNNGCVGVSDWVLLEEPNDLSFIATSINAVDCFASDEGMINLEITGGITPYSFVWNNGDTVQNISNLAAGDYYVTIEDANGCLEISEQALTITGPESLLAVSALEVIDHIDCQEETGSITLNLGGGTPPYAYLWSNGATTNAIEDLSSGIYKCTITDASFCETITAEYSIENPVGFSLNTITQPATGTNSNGMATVEIVGGVWPFEFTWDAATGYSQDSLVMGLAAGIYQVTVVDALGCSSVAAIELDMMTATHDFSQSTIRVFPNPSSGTVYMDLGNTDFENFQVAIYSMDGRLIQAYLDPTIDNNLFKFTLESNPAGIYLLKILVDQKAVYFSKLIVNQ